MGGSNLQYVSKYISRSKFIFTILEHDIYINELDDDVKLSGKITTAQDLMVSLMNFQSSFGRN